MEIAVNAVINIDRYTSTLSILCSPDDLAKFPFFKGKKIFWDSTTFYPIISEGVNNQRSTIVMRRQNLYDSSVIYVPYQIFLNGKLHTNIR